MGSKISSIILLLSLAMHNQQTEGASLCRNEHCSGPPYDCPQSSTLCRRRLCHYYETCNFDGRKGVVVSVHVKKHRLGSSREWKASWKLKVYVEDETDRDDTARALETMHLQKVWDFQIVKEPPSCVSHVNNTPVLFFNDWQFYGNYYHFTYDALLPLFRQLQRRNLNPFPNDALILPAYQTAWFEPQDYSTKAFENLDSFYMDMLVSLFPDSVVPVDARGISIVNGVCFSNASFGLPFVWDDGIIDQSPPPFTPHSKFIRNVPDTRRSLLRSFATFVRQQLSLEPFTEEYMETLACNSTIRVGIISRRQRRKILNEKDLAKSVPEIMMQEHPQLQVTCELVDFNGMSYKEQVRRAGNFDVLVGMNGAGLINAWYTHPDAVIIQLLPHGSNLNFDEFRSILRAVIPPFINNSDVATPSSEDHYMEWKNQYKENAIQSSRQLQQFENEDTIVNVNEFHSLMRRAVTQVINTRMSRLRQNPSVLQNRSKLTRNSMIRAEVSDDGV